MDFHVRDKQAGNALRNLQPHQTRAERVVEWLNDLRATGNRVMLGGVIVAGAAVSLVIGMVLGGAFEGIDVALPPPGHAGTTPIIQYAAPAASHSTHPATAAAGSTKKKSAPTTTTVPKTTTTTSAKAVLTSSSGTNPALPSTTTTPTTPPTTTPPPPTTTTTKPNPLCKDLRLKC